MVSGMRKAMSNDIDGSCVSRQMIEMSKKISRRSKPDLVRVTRCRNCEYYKNHPNGLCYLHTEPKANKQGYSGVAVCVEQNDFCSYGKPKKGK